MSLLHSAISPIPPDGLTPSESETGEGKQYFSACFPWLTFSRSSLLPSTLLPTHIPSLSLSRFLLCSRCPVSCDKTEYLCISFPSFGTIPASVSSFTFFPRNSAASSLELLFLVSSRNFSAQTPFRAIPLNAFLWIPNVIPELRSAAPLHQTFS